MNSYELIAWAERRRCEGEEYKYHKKRRKGDSEGESKRALNQWMFMLLLLCWDLSLLMLSCVWGWVVRRPDIWPERAVCLRVAEEGQQ